MRHFAPFGAVVAVKLCLKGCFGFVHFREHAAAVGAICAMNGRPIHGRPVKCAWGRSPALSAGGAAKAAGGRNPDFNMHPNLRPALSAAAAAQQMQLQAMAALRLGVVGGMGGAQGVSLPAMCQGMGLGFSTGMPFSGQQGLAAQQGFFGGQLGFASQGFGAQGGGHLGAHAAGLYPGGLTAGVNGLGASVSRSMGADAFARAGGLADTFAALHAYKASLGVGGAACDSTVNPVMTPGGMAPTPSSFSLAAAWGEIGQARALDAATQAAALGLLPNGFQGVNLYPNPAAPQLHAQEPVHAQKSQMFAM